MRAGGVVAEFGFHAKGVVHLDLVKVVDAAAGDAGDDGVVGIVGAELDVVFGSRDEGEVETAGEVVDFGDIVAVHSGLLDAVGSDVGKFVDGGNHSVGVSGVGE